MILKYFFGVWLWAATVVMVVPGELVHLLMGHEDTKDDVHVDGKQSFENIHVHCFILKAQLPEYISFHNPESIYKVPTDGSYACIYRSPLIPYHLFSEELRAPPRKN